MRAVKISVLQKRDSFSPTVTSFLLLSNTLSSVIIWHTANFAAYLDILCSYMQEMISGHLISSSLTEQATNMYQVAEEIKFLKA